MNQVVILMGSNLGNRYNQLVRALLAMAEQVGSVISTSSVYETAPWGNTEQPAFLNQIVLLESALSARKLLEKLLKIENAMGRKREEKWAPRIIDLDILFYNDEIIDEADLIVPHPFLQDRRFTLIPLVEMMPEKIHPKLGKSMEELLRSCPDFSEVNLFTIDN